MEIKFEPKQVIWLIYNNQITQAPIHEVRLYSLNIPHYYFWHQDFTTKDPNLVYDNTFKIDSSKLFETKEDLIKSL